MCDPVTALSVGIAGLNYFGGQASAKAQQQANNNSTALQYQQLNEKQQQTNDKYALDQTERIKQGMVERGHIAAIAGESGALGFSSDRLVNDSFMQEGLDISTLEKNRLTDLNTIQYEQKATQAASQANSAKIAASTPTLVGTGLQIGSDIYSAKSNAKKATVV